MDNEMLVTVVVTFLISAAIYFVFFKNYLSKTNKTLEDQTSKTRELEVQIHIKERDYLEDRNRIALQHTADLQIARSNAFEEGRQQGLAEEKSTHINEMTDLRLELSRRFEIEREQAVVEARDRLQAEYELQTKLFSVKISPYVKITEDKGIFGDKYETITGYQYQLLINGIPAFSPHVVPERTETKKAVNEELEKMLINTAQFAAESAIQLYLGKNNRQFARLAAPLVERLTKA